MNLNFGNYFQALTVVTGMQCTLQDLIEYIFYSWSWIPIGVILQRGVVKEKVIETKKFLKYLIRLSSISTFSRACYNAIMFLTPNSSRGRSLVDWNTYWGVKFAVHEPYNWTTGLSYIDRWIRDSYIKARWEISTNSILVYARKMLIYLSRLTLNFNHPQTLSFSHIIIRGWFKNKRHS